MTPTISIIAAYNYMLLKLAVRYVKNDRDKFFGSLNVTSPPISFIDSIRKFNSDNDFIYQKVSLFPFLVSVANGRLSKEKMLKFFNYEEFQFVAESYGVVHVVISDYLLMLYNLNNETPTKPALIRFVKKNASIADSPNAEIDKNKIINFYAPAGLSTIKALTEPLMNSSNELQDFIINYFILNNVQLAAQDPKFPQPSTNEANIVIANLRLVLDKIDHCIDFLHDKRLERFVNRDAEYISSMSKNNSSYRMYRALIEKIGNTKSTKEFFLNSLRAEYFALT